VISQRREGDIHFWEFGGLQQIALENAFGESAKFFALDAYKPIKESALSENCVAVCSLTTENYQKLTPILKALSQSPMHVVLVTNVSSLSYLWLHPEEMPNKLSLVRDDHEILTNLNRVLQSPRPLEEFSHDALLWGSIFTDRQHMIFKGIIHGETNRKIAEAIFQSEKTVEAEIKKICGILNIAEKKTEQNIRVLIGQRYAQLVGVL
jgi:hypothetical protein